MTMTPEPVSESRSRVLPLVADPGNRQLLGEWIDKHPAYDAVELAESVDETDFDVCILDRGAFEEHLDSLRAKKTAVAPVVLPYLLLLPDADPEVIDTDAGQLADNVVTKTIDEIVSMPMQQAELHWRLEALLRLREQSLTLHEQRHELERQVDLFEKAEDLTDLGAWEYDIESETNWWTDGVYRIYGLPEDAELTPEEGIQYYHPDDRPVIEEAYAAAIEEGEPYDIEVRFIDAEDNHRWVRTRGEPQYDDGELTRVRGTIRDITARKERELNLQRIEQAVEASGHAIFITDTDGKIEYVNSTFEEMTGYTQEEVVGETPHVLRSGEMPDGYFEDQWNTILSGEMWEEEMVNRRKNGELYTARQTIAPVTDDGEIHAFVAVHDDITERKEREETLYRRTGAIDEAPVGITITDSDQEDNPMIYVNDAFVEMTGYPREASLGENCRFLQGENTDPDQVARIREAIDAERPISIELRNYRNDGTEFWNHLEIAPVRNDAGAVVNWIGFQQDVTERKQRQQQLATLDRVLRHNLRNDMNVIRGQAETIRAEASGVVKDSAGKIVDMSDELIEMAEKERKITELLREDPTQVEINLEELLVGVASEARSEYPDARVTVDCPDGVIIEATKEIEQAIRELVTNAIVHNDVASPEVAITVTETDEATRLDVADNGPRLPDMERNVLEDETEQTPLYHGTGLGLWFVRLIASRSGGGIHVAENSPTGNIVGIEFD